MSQLPVQLTVIEAILLAFIIVGVLLALYLLASIVRAVLDRRKRQAADVIASSEDSPSESAPSEPEAEQEAEPQTPLDERDMLKKREGELKEREARIKEEKKKELAERERHIKRGHDDEISPEGAENFFMQPGLGDYEAEKKRITDFIKTAEERYGRGELSDQNFRRIVSDYQEQLIDLDVKMKKRKEDI